jgi:segregation and condensation protein B
MEENENDINDSAAKHDVVEELQAEEFAEEMHAEPKNIDGEAGVATVEEEAAAEDAGQGPTLPSDGEPADSMSPEEILAPDAGREQPKWPAEDAELTAMLEAVIYITDEPLTLEQISTALEQPRERIKRLLDDLVAEWQKPQHGLSIREVAGGYKMATKPEHHDAVRQFVKSLKAPMKLSLPALETLAVIAYKQPVTAPEIMDIRGVQGAGVLKTLLDRKLIAAAGRKNVIGKPILYKTTKEFLVQFGLKDLSELPSVKEFEELARFATAEPEPASPPPESAAPEAAACEPVAPEPARQEEPQPEAPQEEPVPEPVTE